MNGRERVMALLEGHTPDRLPCMPITMQLACQRTGRSYREYETDFRVLAEGQIRIAEEFDLDYVNTMSDPVREAADCGAEIVFAEDSPAATIDARPLLKEKADLLRLRVPDPRSPGRMDNGLQAIAYLKEAAGREKIVEGWIEGPCAEAADLRGMSNLMLDMIDDAAFVRDLFEFVLAMELWFAEEQVAAGADVIGIGDAAASLIGPRLYEDLVWPYEKRLVDGIHGFGARVRLHICGNTRRILSGMGKLGCDIVDLDFLSPLAEAREQMGPRQILLGNIDPVRVLRNGSPDDVYSAFDCCYRAAGPRYVVGAGCEVPVDTPPQNLHALVRFAREHGC